MEDVDIDIKKKLYVFFIYGLLLLSWGWSMESRSNDTMDGDVCDCIQCQLVDSELSGVSLDGPDEEEGHPIDLKKELEIDDIERLYIRDEISITTEK
jgi:hypothetical protein